MKGKAPGGEAHLEIFFSPPEPKTYKENKPTRLLWVPEADRHTLTQCWAGSKLGTSTSGLGALAGVESTGGYAGTKLWGTHVCRSGSGPEMGQS